MIKRLLLAAVAAAACFLPVQAEIQEGTSRLLETIDKEGILVTINSDACLTNGANGQYKWLGFKREMVLCPGDTIDANDHNTVRHEVIHAIQHCINLTRRTNFDTPIIQHVPDLMKFVNTHLSQQEINSITSVYDRSQWLTELEAFAGAKAYTSSQLEKFFIDACTLQESFDG
jgi:hypothetical protein